VVVVTSGSLNDHCLGDRTRISEVSLPEEHQNLGWSKKWKNVSRRLGKGEDIGRS
jgi:hypothetical protein